MYHWIETVLSVLYSLNVLIGAVGYIPMLIKLTQLYLQGQSDRGLTASTYFIWALGAFSTTAFGFGVAKEIEMVLVGGTTFIFNLAIVILIVLIRAKAKQGGKTLKE